MNNLQYDSFYKFLVSLGIVLLTLPIFAVLYILNADYILISQTDYDNLSAISLHILETHVHTLQLVNDIIPIIVPLSSIIGLILIIIGSYKWYGIQKQLDEQIKSDTITKTINATQLSTSQTTEKAFKELSSEQESNEAITTDKVVKYMEIEDKCFNYFVRRLSRRYHLKQNLLISNVEYDMVGISKQNFTDLIFEVKHWTTSPSEERLRQLITHLKCLGENYKKTTDHDFEYVMVFVTPKSQHERIRKKVEAFYSNNTPDIPEHINLEFFIEDDL